MAGGSINESSASYTTTDWQVNLCHFWTSGGNWKGACPKGACPFQKIAFPQNLVTDFRIIFWDRAENYSIQQSTFSRWWIHPPTPIKYAALIFWPPEHSPPSFRDTRGVVSRYLIFSRYNYIMYFIIIRFVGISTLLKWQNGYCMNLLVYWDRYNGISMNTAHAFSEVSDYLQHRIHHSW